MRTKLHYLLTCFRVGELSEASLAASDDESYGSVRPDVPSTSHTLAFPSPPTSVIGSVNRSSPTEVDPSLNSGTPLIGKCWFSHDHKITYM